MAIFEWDTQKARANLAKHEVSFDDAALIFDDPNLVVRRDWVDDTGEQRWRAFGSALGRPTLLVVVHVYRESKDGEEIIRIISARQASKKESRRYLQ